MAEIRGYSTGCDGKLRIIGENETISSRVYANPGNISLHIEAQTEPGYQDGFSGNASYMCIRRMQHEVHFIAQPGKSYRLSLSGSGNEQYQIEVREAPTPREIEASLIQSRSSQLWVKKLCGFFGTRAGCDNRILH